MNIRPYRHIERRKSKKIKVGNISVGGDAPISVQTMTNTPTTDIDLTLDQIEKCVEVIESFASIGMSRTMTMANALEITE